MKPALIVLGFVALGVALADMATGNTDHPILPSIVGNHLDQQSDLAVGAVGAGCLWFAFAKL